VRKMLKKIFVKRVGRGGYGNEYEAIYMEGEEVKGKVRMFGADVKYAGNAFRQGWQSVPVTRLYGKRRVK
jgi:hypothetical protein